LKNKRRLNEHNIDYSKSRRCALIPEQIQRNLGYKCCGYLSQPNARAFNKGKQQEVINRVKHIQNEQ